MKSIVFLCSVFAASVSAQVVVVITGGDKPVVVVAKIFPSGVNPHGPHRPILQLPPPFFDDHARSLLPSVTPSSFQTVYKVVTTVYPVLSKSPIAPFLPSPMTMALDAIKVYNAASNFNDGMKVAWESVLDTMQKAADVAKYPAEELDKLIAQIVQLWNQGQVAASQVATSAVNSAVDSVTSARPVY